MNKRYDGVKFYGINDFTFGVNFQKAQKIMDSFDIKKEYYDINEIIELYNVNIFFTCEQIKKEYIEPYKDRTNHLKKLVAKFFNKIDDGNFCKQYHAVCINYLDDFWTLFEKFNIFQNINDTTFSALLSEEESLIHEILKHEKIINRFDSVLSKFIRNSNRSAEIIISKFFKKKDTNAKKLFLPKSLKPNEYEIILKEYIESENPNINILHILASSQSNSECPISDKLRLQARRKSEELKKSLIGTGVVLEYGFYLLFREIDEAKKVDIEGERIIKYSYDINWIKDNLDYPTLLNNFIYLFEFADSQSRCTFPSVESQMGISAFIGVKGVREYESGIFFKYKDRLSNEQMKRYKEILLKLNIRIEDVFQWFFNEYLKAEFGVNGFSINMPSANSMTLEKCKSISSEMDGILKQYRMYAEDHIIDRELFEISSQHILFKDVPSMLENKYAYSNSQDTKNEQFFLFSNQSLLSYTEKYGDKFNNFFQLITSVDVKMNDFSEFQINDIKWLERRTSIYIDEKGIIKPNIVRCILLQDLYKHEVIRPYYYKSKTEIDKMINSKDLRYQNSLFSIPEQNYLNYMLNKSEYSNGKDLRNKYNHSTYSLDKNQQEYDYNELLKIMAIIIIKINEEFDLIDKMNKSK